MRVAFSRTVVCGAVLFMLAGCATQNQTGGTAIGAVVGGLIGHAIAGDRGAALGIAVGAAFGNAIGRKLDEADRQKLAEAQRRALAEQTQQTFFAKSAGSNVVVTPGPTYYEPSRRQLALASDIKRVDVVESSNINSVALLDVPIYRSADFAAPPKLTIPRGANITRVAFVKADPNWVLVGDQNFAIGYVPSIYFDPEIAKKLLSATNVERAAAAAPPARTPAPTRQSAPTPPSVTDQLLSGSANYVPPAAHMRQSAVSQDAYKRVVDTGTQNARTKSGGVSFVEPSVECRELTSVLLTNDKETGREVNKACRKPGTGWTL